MTHCNAVTDVHADVEHAPMLKTELVAVASTVPKLTPETVASTPPERAKLGVCAFVTAGAARTSSTRNLCDTQRALRKACVPSKLKTPVPVPASPATVKYCALPPVDMPA